MLLEVRVVVTCTEEVKEGLGGDPRGISRADDGIVLFPDLCCAYMHMFIF